MAPAATATAAAQRWARRAGVGERVAAAVLAAAMEGCLALAAPPAEEAAAIAAGA